MLGSVYVNGMAVIARSFGEASILADRAVVVSPSPGCIVAKERISLEPPRNVPSSELNAIRWRLAVMFRVENLREAV